MGRVGRESAGAVRASARARAGRSRRRRRRAADHAVELAGGRLEDTAFEYTGGSRGWKGDIPIVRLNTDRIRALGWRNQFGSREALTTSMTAMLDLAEARRV